MKGLRIIMAEDEDAVAAILKAYLEREGMLVDRVGDGVAALAAVRGRRYDLLILDVGLPGLDGYEVCRELRGEGITLPILFLTARGEEIDLVLGLSMGGDGYLVKPVLGSAVVAWIRAFSRRWDWQAQAGSGSPPVLRFGALEIDLAAGIVRREGTPLALTAKEFALLKFLASNEGRTFTREQLFEAVWDPTLTEDDSTVTVHIRRLRERIEADPATPQYVLTTRGLGYRFAGGGK